MSTVSARALTLVGLWAAAGCGVPGRATKVDPAKAFLSVSVGPQVIVPEHIFKDVDVTAFANENPVATGPFTVVTRFEPGVYELGRNQAYWQPGKPAVAGLRLPALASNEQATRALLAGELDW